MRRITLATILVSVMALGAFSLCLGAGGEPGPPCNPDLLPHCLDYVDPVECVKPGQGWTWYSNACYAMRDCALMSTCRSLGT